MSRDDSPENAETSKDGRKAFVGADATEAALVYWRLWRRNWRPPYEAPRTAQRDEAGDGG